MSTCKVCHKIVPPPNVTWGMNPMEMCNGHSAIDEREIQTGVPSTSAILYSQKIQEVTNKLFLELIGPDERPIGGYLSPEAYWHNDLRRILREKVEELYR